MTRFSRLSGPGLLALALLAGGSAAGAQTAPPATCPPAKDGEELRDLPEIRADKGVLSTTFSVEMKPQCVPMSDSNGVVTVTSMPLRTYVYPDPVTKEPRWGFPGPTLRIRKQEQLPDGKGTTPGDRLKILLVNKLPPDATEHGKCDDACAGTGVDCSQIGKLPTGLECAAAAGDPSHPRVLPGCCCLVNQSQTWPECFHGDNSTNLHFHGTHVSPQPPQDFVLLELRPDQPPGANNANQSSHATHTRGMVAYGQYQYDVDPPPPTQAEGTHWYHPHKHGSVSLQVANGMPGALIIEGAFDDWLRGWYGGRLKEKILVVQQVKQQTNLYNNPLAPPTLVNGQMNPTVTLQPGEVQRWRIINATMEVGSQILVTFPQGAQVRQIAMDGVRFSPANYRTQPLCNFDDPCQVLISPGNRADFLVQAPGEEGLHRVAHSLAHPGVVAPGKRLKLQRRDEALLQLETQRLGMRKAADGDSSKPALFTLRVQKAPPGEAVVTGFPPPSQWPEMPWYLRDLPARTDGTKSLEFQMTGVPGDPSTQFKISGRQFDDKCAQVTTRLDTTDAWTIQNSSPLAHPFHIHINPFQLVEQGTILDNQPVAFVKYDSPIWQDTVALPVQNNTWDVEAGPIWNQQDAERKCPTVCQVASGGKWSGNWRTTVPGTMSVCGCSYTGNGYVLLRHRYLEFTGEYVLHCHFLGHEDRGMMFSVQTVCKDDPTKFGKSTPYPQPECAAGNLIPAAPVCPPAASASGHAGH